MSQLRVNEIVSENGSGSPSFPNGISIDGINAGVSTFSGDVRFNGDIIGDGDTNISGIDQITAVSGNFSENVSVAGTVIFEDVTNVDSLGVVTARQGIRVGAGESIGSDGGDDVSYYGTYYGDGSSLTGVISGVGLQTAGGYVGSGATVLDFRGSGVSTVSAPVGGIATVYVEGGSGGGGSFASESLTPTNAVATLDLTNAQDHKVTAAGIVTLTASGGVEGESHTVRIINSGITTVGFSTFFLFPSGSTPVLPIADGSISVVSFTVNQVGSVGIQLLAGASVNFS